VPFQQSPARAPARAKGLARTAPSEWDGLPKARAECKTAGNIGSFGQRSRGGQSGPRALGAKTRRRDDATTRRRDDATSEHGEPAMN